MSQIYTSVTDERMVADIVAPGYGADDITVKTAKVSDGNGGKKVLIKVEGKYSRPTGKTGKLVPRFAFDKVVGDGFKEVIDDDRLTDGDFDTDGIKYSVKNGVVRISIPKTAEATGKVLTASADANGIVETTEAE